MRIMIGLACLGDRVHRLTSLCVSQMTSLLLRDGHAVLNEQAVEDSAGAHEILLHRALDEEVDFLLLWQDSTLAQIPTDVPVAGLFAPGEAVTCVVCGDPDGSAPAYLSAEKGVESFDYAELPKRVTSAGEGFAWIPRSALLALEKADLLDQCESSISSALHKVGVSVIASRCPRLGWIGFDGTEHWSPDLSPIEAPPSWPGLDLPVRTYLKQAARVAPSHLPSMPCPSLTEPPPAPAPWADLKRPVKVAIVVPSLTIGGAERQAVSIARGLYDLGFEVVVLNLGGTWSPLAAELDESNIRWVSVDPKDDLVDDHLSTADATLWWGGLLIGRVPSDEPIPGSIYIVHTACRWSEQALRAVARTQLLKTVVAACGPAARMAEAVLGMPVGSVPVIWNGASPLLSKVPRRPFPGPEDPVVLGYVGRFGHEKNLVGLVAALTFLPPRFSLKLFGANRSGELEPLILRAAEEFMVKNRVSITPPTGDLTAIYSSIDCLCLPSFYEGSPFVVAEAMLAGVPIVTTLHGDAPVIFKGGQTISGLAPTPELIAGAIELMMSDPGLSPRIFENRRFALEHLTEDRMVAGYAALIAETVERGRSLSAPAEDRQPEELSPETPPESAARMLEVDHSISSSPLLPSTPEPAPEPRSTRAARKPKVALIADVPDWAFDINERDWAAHDDSFAFEHLYVVDVKSWPDLRRFDAAYAALHRWPIGHLLPWGRTLGALRSRWFIPEHPGPATDADVRLVNSFRAFHVVTAENYAEVIGRCPNLFYLTNPVSMRRFPKPTEVQGRVIACWNGNALHFNSAGVDVKGLGMVRLAAAQADVPLVVAEYNTARIPSAEMPNWYRQANVAISMGLYEGASNSVMEAMAAGLAMVCTDTGNHREMRDSQILRFGETGIILVERSAEALAKALRELASCPDYVAHMGEVNRKSIAEDWSWERWAPRYKRFLEVVTG